MDNIYLLIGALTGVLGLVGFLWAVASRYKRCPSDKILVIYGKVGGGTSKCVHGGGAFVWPIIQDYAYMDLTPIPINIPLKDALTKQNIRVEVPSVVTVAVSSDPQVVQNAAERILSFGGKRGELENLVKEIVYGQMRLVINQMTIEEISTDREKLFVAIKENLSVELKKIGLDLINVNITDINDSSEYIKSLGREAASRAINEAKVKEAENRKTGEIGVANADRDREMSVAKTETQKATEVSKQIAMKDIAVAEADRDRRTRSASLDAEAIQGENQSLIQIAQSNSEKQVKEAEAYQTAESAKALAQGRVTESQVEAQTKVELRRQEQVKAQLEASVIIPEKANQEKLLIEADTQKLSSIKAAEAEAEAIRLEAEARAFGEYQLLSQKAKGFKELIDSAGSAEAAVKLFMIEQLPRITQIQVEALKNIKFDKVVVWDSGNGSGGEGTNSTTGFVQNLFKMLPGMQEVYEMIGKTLPSMVDINPNYTPTTPVDVESTEVDKK
jgi:flotillin